jgi:hopanoid biosynthesis associated protein HpnK
LIDWAVWRLIINADDFGLTAGVNRAVMELHEKGALTSATIMALAAATDEAIELALKAPLLGVGCHVVLIDGEPVLPAAEIPSLTDRQTGRFHTKPGSFLRRLLLGRIRAAEIEAEAAAQIALLQGRGLTLTHIDTHKHLHMFPAVLRPLLRAARAAGICAVRNPFEPTWSRHATAGASLFRRIEVNMLRQLEPAFRRIVAEEGFLTTGGSLGVLATGTLDEDTLRSVLGSMPAGTWELVTHPGYNDNDLTRTRTRLRQSRDAERKALLAVAEIEGLALINFAQLAARDADSSINSAMK